MGRPVPIDGSSGGGQDNNVDKAVPVSDSRHTSSGHQEVNLLADLLGSAIVKGSGNSGEEGKGRSSGIA